MSMLPISAIILTHNEEANIGPCLQRLVEQVSDIYIVDSYSTDRTVEMCGRYTSHIHQHPFENYARQLNWAIKNLPVRTEWVMRLDADETLSPELIHELTLKLPALEEDVSGVYFKRRVHFMGRWIRHGSMYPIWHLRLWRTGKAYCEDRWMDEHMKVISGKLVRLHNDIIDDNRKNLHWWIDKHNKYASREMADLVRLQYGIHGENEVTPNIRGTQDQRKRWMKTWYARMPLFIRPVLYFLYRYIFRLGFLDGREGLVWHFLQGFWYRFLVDAKIFEMRKSCGDDRDAIVQFMKKEHGLSLEQ